MTRHHCRRRRRRRHIHNRLARRYQTSALQYFSTTPHTFFFRTHDCECETANRIKSRTSDIITIRRHRCHRVVMCYQQFSIEVALSLTHARSVWCRMNVVGHVCICMRERPNARTLNKFLGILRPSNVCHIHTRSIWTTQNQSMYKGDNAGNHVCLCSIALWRYTDWQNNNKTLWDCELSIDKWVRPVRTETHTHSTFVYIRMRRRKKKKRKKQTKRHNENKNKQINNAKFSSRLL